MSDENRELTFDIIDEPKRNEDDARKHEIGTTESNGAPKSVDGIGTIDPFTTTDTGNAGTQPRRRGRPPGSKNRTATGTDAGNPQTKKERDKVVGVNLEELLLSIHCMGAAFLSSPELELEEDEAKKIAHHLTKVSELYNHVFDPKTLIWGGLVFTLLEIYGTRGVAIYNRVTADKPPTPGKPVLVPNPQTTQPAKETRIENPSQIWPVAPVEDSGE